MNSKSSSSSPRAGRAPVSMSSSPTASPMESSTSSWICIDSEDAAESRERASPRFSHAMRVEQFGSRLEGRGSAHRTPPGSDTLHSSPSSLLEGDTPSVHPPTLAENMLTADQPRDREEEDAVSPDGTIHLKDPLWLNSPQIMSPSSCSSGSPRLYLAHLPSATSIDSLFEDPQLGSGRMWNAQRERETDQLHLLSPVFTKPAALKAATVEGSPQQEQAPKVQQQKQEVPAVSPSTQSPRPILSSNAKSLANAALNILQLREPEDTSAESKAAQSVVRADEDDISPSRAPTLRQTENQPPHPVSGDTRAAEPVNPLLTNPRSSTGRLNAAALVAQHRDMVQPSLAVLAILALALDTRSSLRFVACTVALCMSLTFVRPPRLKGSSGGSRSQSARTKRQGEADVSSTSPEKQMATVVLTTFPLVFELVRYCASHPVLGSLGVALTLQYVCGPFYRALVRRAPYLATHEIAALILLVCVADSVYRSALHFVGMRRKSAEG